MRLGLLPLTTKPSLVAPLIAPLPRSSVPLVATPVRLTLFAPPDELIGSDVLLIVPVVRFRARPLVLIDVSEIVSVPKLDPVMAVPVASTLPSAMPRMVLPELSVTALAEAVAFVTDTVVPVG